MKKLLLLLPLLLLLVRCSKDNDASQECNQFEDRGIVQLSEDALTFKPQFYENRDSIVFINALGDVMVFYQESGFTFFVESFGEEPCDEGTNVYKYELENASQRFQSDAYILSISLSLRLNLEIISVDTLTSIVESQRDTCYSEFVRVSLVNNTTTLPIFFEIDSGNSNCVDSDISSTFGFEFDESLDILGNTFNDVYSNKRQLLFDTIQQKVYFNKSLGFIGFEDNEGELWGLVN